MARFLYREGARVQEKKTGGIDIAVEEDLVESVLVG